MATPTHPTTSHEERTAQEPRDAEIHSVIIDDITEINLSVRLFRLKTVNGLPMTVRRPCPTPAMCNTALGLFSCEVDTQFQFLPGQWLDTFVPGIPKAGGFTITSPPHLAYSPVPYVELAIQRSPTNPPAAWLFQPTAQVLGRTLQVRVGGAFVWPPPRIELASVQNILFVAGGVGINPLMSIVSHLTSGQNPPPFTVEFMYATKIPSEAWDNGSLRLDNILFMTRLLKIFSEGSIAGRLSLFLTGDTRGEKAVINLQRAEQSNPKACVAHCRRMAVHDLEKALGPKDRHHACVAYICGVPAMTDMLAQYLTGSGGLSIGKDQVLFEKWW